MTSKLNMSSKDTQDELINRFNSSYTDNFNIKVEFESETDQYNIQNNENGFKGEELKFYDFVFCGEGGELIEQNIDFNVTSSSNLDGYNYENHEEFIKQNYVLKSDMNEIQNEVMEAEKLLIINVDVEKCKESSSLNNNYHENLKKNGESNSFLSGPWFQRHAVFQCKQCSSTFKNNEEMLEHTKAIHGNNSYNQKSFMNVREHFSGDFFGDLEQNLLKPLRFEQYTILPKQSKVPQVLSCKKCSEMFTTNCINVRNQVCKNCKTGLDKDTALGKSKKDEMHTICRICFKKFSDSVWLKHMIEKHGPQNAMCNYCSQVFKSKVYVKRHIMLKHCAVPRNNNSETTDTREKCTQCPKYFKDKCYLKLHMKNCHGVKSECEICHSKFSSLPYLNTHKRRVHYDDGKIHKCTICYKTFTSPRNVSIHVKNAHKNKRTVKCMTCKRIYTKDNFKVHHNKCLKKHFDVTVKKN